jgi:glucose/arabinose dehydrogenase
MLLQVQNLFVRPSVFILMFVLISLAPLGMGASLPASFSEQQVASGLSQPTAMAEAPDGRIFVCEQTGKLRVIKNGALLSAPFLTVTVDSNGERGLLGVAFDPNFASNRFIYVYYTTPSPSVHNRVSRFTANGDVAVSGSEVVLLELPNLSATNHNGGALHFGPDGMLYIAVGENAVSSNAQTLSNPLGKILRINKDGSIPTSNPFYGSTTGNSRAIWALGLRNPFTFGFQPGTGRIFINDVGQSTWEEINNGQSGANYGWPTTEGATTDARFVSPVFSYGHGSTGTTGCAIVGSAFYNPPTQQFPTSYMGAYFFSDYCSGWIRKLDTVNNNTVSGFATGISSPVDLLVAADGSLYYLARGSGSTTGVVYRITYASTQPPTITQQPANKTVSMGQSATFTVVATGTQPLSYQWQRNSATISGATSSSYTLASAQSSDNGALFRCVVTNSFGTVTSNNAQLTVSGNSAPVGTITSPAAGTTYVAGSTINYAGTGTDTEDGTLPASAFTWQVDFHHDTHVHPFIAPTTGAKSGSFTIPNTGETSANVWYRIYLTVKDSAGATNQVFRDIRPQTSVITLQTAPAGLSLNLDGQPVTTPYSVTSVVGMIRSLGAPATATQGGVTYNFASWSDGGSATHNIATSSSNATYTATYTASSGGSGGATLVPIADSFVRDGSYANTNFGTTNPLNTKLNAAVGYNRWVYLKFDLSSVSSFATATLQMRGALGDTSGTNVPTAVYPVSDTSWTETGITWNNRPTTSATELARVTVPDMTFRTFTWDVTSYLKSEKAAGRNIVTLALKNPVANETHTLWTSREATANKPVLVLK